MPPVDDELRARIYSLPTRDELQHIFDQFVTKELFKSELDRMKDDIKELQGHPETKRGQILWLVTVVSLSINAVGLLLQHIIWR
jgi:hypothetical protein